MSTDSDISDIKITEDIDRMANKSRTERILRRIALAGTGLIVNKTTPSGLSMWRRRLLHLGTGFTAMKTNPQIARTNFRFALRGRFY